MSPSINFNKRSENNIKSIENILIISNVIGICPIYNFTKKSFFNLKLYIAYARLVISLYAILCILDICQKFNWVQSIEFETTITVSVMKNISIVTLNLITLTSITFYKRKAYKKLLDNIIFMFNTQNKMILTIKTKELKTVSEIILVLILFLSVFILDVYVWCAKVNFPNYWKSMVVDIVQIFHAFFTVYLIFFLHVSLCINFKNSTRHYYMLKKIFLEIRLFFQKHLILNHQTLKL